MTVIFKADFEKGDFSEWEGVQKFAGDRARVVTTPVRDGKYAARIEVKAGEYIGGDSTGKRNRCEMMAAKGRHEPKEGSDWFYRLSFYVPSQTVLPPNGNSGSFAIMQMISTGPTSLPQTDFQLGNVGFADWKARGDGGPGYTEFSYSDRPAPGEPDKHWAIPATQVTRSTWHELVLHKKWSSDPAKGFIEVIWNGKPQKLRDGSNRIYMKTLTAPYSAYLKAGIYSLDMVPDPRVMFFDSVGVATALADLYSGSPPPPPTPAPVPARYSITCPVCSTRFTT